MAKKNPNLPPDDDGETIVNMNVDGMPWYMRESPDSGDSGNASHPKMSMEEERMYTWAAVKAGLLIVLVFAVAFALLIAFMDFVWFR